MKIAVIGAGTMGSGIAQVCAFHGHQVYLIDRRKEDLERGLQNIQSSLHRVLWKMETEASKAHYQETLERVHPVLDWEALAPAEFIIEAVYEDLEAKKQVLQALDQICSPQAVLASNTSSISITRLGGFTQHPERVVGMHFMNPVPVMKLVEIVRSLATSQETYEKTHQLTLDLDKNPVEAQDFPGFISNRILMPMVNEAIYTVMEGVGEAAAIDQVMKLGMRHPMGPLELADFIGLDVCLAIMNVLYGEFKDSKYRPCPLLQRMVDAGWLGKKTGKGFYPYHEDGRLARPS